LQGLYRQRIPMYTLLLGVIIKIAINYTAVQQPEFNIFGAPWASLACYLISAGLNLYYVAKYARMKVDWRDLLLRPGLAAAIMALPVLVILRLAGRHLYTSWSLMGLTILLAAAVFFIAAYKLGAVKRSDLPARFQAR
ncbi:MAG TPA: polysaccharide biosynthesis C-terminal domain-containing protein, partial [Clostridia bacterium]|nr:polysaccharide biosynthesis C-terminal domain-containing protein [Clostridia bacterium]